MPELLDSNSLLFNLHRGAEIAEKFSECLEPELIANQLTNGLVEKFNCAFARIWLLERDQQFLKLVASSGMYTRTNGFFSRVPLGAYKVGKIAQNRVSFLSNNLPEEPWVGNREWAIANKIKGFAGYPLIIRGKVLGVLASFSHHTMTSEFLEVLPTLCTMVSIALDSALQHQQEKQTWQSSSVFPSFRHFSLSDQLASILSSTRLTLVGIEQSLTLPLVYVFLEAAETLNKIGCAYCRLIYTTNYVALEGIVPPFNMSIPEQENWIKSAFGDLFFMASCLGGMLNTQIGDSQRGIQIEIKIPYPSCKFGQSLRIQCKFPVLQMAFTHLSFLAGLTVCDAIEDEIPLLTDDISQIDLAKQVLWIQQGNQALPKGIQAKLDLSITSEQLRDAVETVSSGQSWGIPSDSELPQLSERELEMMRLLVQGWRDRDIANHLIISESTVKFHINNVLTKLKAKTRYQALHQVIVNGWL